MPAFPSNAALASPIFFPALPPESPAFSIRAHWGQVKADAGAGYELEAITAVVLGGTSIFGGRGTIIGTLMGLFVIALLKNGLLLAELPPPVVDSVSDLIHHLPAMAWRIPARRRRIDRRRIFPPNLPAS